MFRKVLAAMLIFAFSAVAYADAPFQVAAKAAILIEAESGRVLFAQNADEKLPMASTTKIMTALLALENNALTEPVKAPEEAVGITGTSIYLTEGETLTLEQLLYGLMLRSGNDAAAAIAIHVAGSQQEFVEMMNARAAELGVDAHFENPHGLDAEGHGASARALAEIMREALKNEDFRRIVGTEKKIIPWEGNEYSRVLYNKNRLLTSYEGTIGGKTGYTSKAGRCLVFAAERDGMTLIGCVLNCSTWFDTAERMLDYGFENYTMKTLHEAGEGIEEVEVTGGRKRKTEVRAAQNLAFPIGLDEKYILKIELKNAVAPLYAGVTAGHVCAVINGEEIARAELVYAEDIHRNNLENAILKILDLWVIAPEKPHRAY